MKSIETATQHDNYAKVLDFIFEDLEPQEAFAFELQMKQTPWLKAMVDGLLLLKAQMNRGDIEKYLLRDTSHLTDL